MALRQVDLGIELQILSFYEQQQATAGAGRRPRAAAPVPVADVLYPVNLVVGRPALRGRRRRARWRPARSEGLVAAGAEVVVIAPRDRRRRSAASAVEVVERPYRRGDLDGAWLAIAATDDPRGQPAVHADGDAARVWVNAADDPAACSFTLPAVVRQGPVMVTVSTAGHSPALAGWLRGRVGGPARPGGRPAGRAAVRGPGRAEGRGPVHRGRRLAPGARLGHARTDPNGPHGPGKGAPAGVSVVVVGLNHRTAPLPVLEADDGALPPGCPRRCTTWPARDHLSEVVVVSTCLRTEVYAVAGRFHGAMSDIRNFFSAWSGIPPEAFADQLYSYYDEAAAAHLFKVAAGLDSAVLGEGEILGQVGDAWDAARAGVAAGPVLSHPVPPRRSRSASGSDRRRPSPGAPRRCRRRPWPWPGPSSGSLAGKTTLVLGAGEMGEAMAQALAGALDAGSLLVANRTWSRATQLAARCGGRAIEWSALPAALVEADVLLASTGSPDVLLEAADLEPVLAARRRPPAAHRRHRRAPRRRPRRRDPAGRDPARHGRPHRLGRRRHGRPPPGGPPGRGHRRRGGRALHWTWPPSAMWPPWSPPCTSGARPSAPAS